jgi:hypothetical protein
MVIKREEEEMELLKREEEQHLERRISEKAKEFWTKVGHGVRLLLLDPTIILIDDHPLPHQAQKVWDTLGPTAVELTAKHYKLVARDIDEALVARALEFADEEEFHKRDEMPEGLVERDFSPIEVEELERRGLSEKAKNFWSKVGHGVRPSLYLMAVHY